MRGYRVSGDAPRHPLSTRAIWRFTSTWNSSQTYPGVISREEVLRRLERLRELNPNNYSIYFALGAVLGVSGNYAEARVHLERCIDITPICVEAYVNKVAINPTHHQRYGNIGIAYALLGQIGY